MCAACHPMPNTRRGTKIEIPKQHPIYLKGISHSQNFLGVADLVTIYWPQICGSNLASSQHAHSGPTDDIVGGIGFGGRGTKIPIVRRAGNLTGVRLYIGPWKTPGRRFVTFMHYLASPMVTEERRNVMVRRHRKMKMTGAKRVMSASRRVKK